MGHSPVAAESATAIESVPTDIAMTGSLGSIDTANATRNMEILPRSRRPATPTGHETLEAVDRAVISGFSFQLFRACGIAE